MQTLTQIFGENYPQNTYYKERVEKSNYKYVGCQEEFDKDNDITFCHQVIMEARKTDIHIKFRMFSASIWPGSGEEMGSTSYSEYEHTILYTDEKEMQQLKEYWDYGSGMSEFMTRTRLQTKEINCSPMSELAKKVDN